MLITAQVRWKIDPRRWVAARCWRSFTAATHDRLNSIKQRRSYRPIADAEPAATTTPFPAGPLAWTSPEPGGQGARVGDGRPAFRYSPLGVQATGQGRLGEGQGAALHAMVRWFRRHLDLPDSDRPHHDGHYRRGGR
jgi:hypothetical protein